MRPMLSTLAAAALAAAVLAAVAPAHAEQADRYRLERTDKGFVRMDTLTGAMSLCEERSGELACKPAADERSADAGKLPELTRRIEALEGRLAALEGKPPAAALPSEEEFEKTMSLMERFLRRFWGVAKDLERESGPNGQAPDRT